MRQIINLILLLSLFLGACQTHLVKTKTNYIKIKELKESEEDISKMIAPYKKDMEKEMNLVIGQTAKMLTLAKPESTLGNWAADLIFAKAGQYTDVKIDFCMLNYGGLRIPSLPKGDITQGKVFELMPFDNTLVVVELKGSDLQLLFDRAAADGGWPVSKHIKVDLYKNKAQMLRINDKKVVQDRIYYVAMNDYMANGGDKCFFLKDKKKIITNKLMRNLFIEYIKETTKAGKKIDANSGQRVFILK